MELINLNLIPAFILVFVRIISFLVTLPLFSYRTIPLPFKLGMSFFLALVLITTLDLPNLAFDGMYIVLLLKEIVVGLFIGLVAYVVVSAVQIAGGFIDFQMGFAIANVVDPQTGAQSPLIGQYFYIIALLFLLSVDGHHFLIDGMFYSYELIPLEKLVSFHDESFAQFIIKTFNQVFLIAFQMAVPLVGCLFLVDVALGIIARTVPQLNVFVVGLPIKIFVSFAVLLIFFGLYITLAKTLFDNMFNIIQSLMQILGGA